MPWSGNSHLQRFRTKSQESWKTHGDIGRALAKRRMTEGRLCHVILAGLTTLLLYGPAPSAPLRSAPRAVLRRRQCAAEAAAAAMEAARGSPQAAAHPSAAALGDAASSGVQRQLRLSAHPASYEAHHALRHPRSRRKAWCHAAGCGKRAAFTDASCTLRVCREHHNASHIRIYKSRSTTRRCQEAGCGRQPNYGPLNAKAVYCLRHKQPHHVNVNRPTCMVQGCKKSRSFGAERSSPPPEWSGQGDAGCQARKGIRRKRGRAEFCYEHRVSGHVNVRASMCGYFGCNKTGIFGNASAGYLCSTHRLFVQASRRCLHPEGCERVAFFGHSKDGVPIFCLRHRKAVHVNCMVRSCAFVEGCRRQPSFGGVNDTLPIYCKTHKHKEHLNLKADRCAYLGADDITV